MDDREIISGLIAESARQLSREHYSGEQIEGAIASVFGVDSDLIKDGTYFVAEGWGVMLGCGGWSRRKTLFGGDQYSTRDAGYLDPKSEPAKIRAFFVHPAHARKGIARAILALRNWGKGSRFSCARVDGNSSGDSVLPVVWFFEDWQL